MSDAAVACLEVQAHGPLAGLKVKGGPVCGLDEGTLRWEKRCVLRCIFMGFLGGIIPCVLFFFEVTHFCI